MFRMRLME